MADFAEGVVTGMATQERGGYPYPVMPMYGYGNGFGGGCNGYGDWIWIIVLFALFGNGGFGGMGGNGAFPWLLQGQTNTDNNVNANFNNSALSNKLDSISDQICDNTINSLQTAYENQISSLNSNFAMQSAFSNCCCENRLGLADLKATVISENCADREQLSNGIRDIITAQTAGTQRVLDKLCEQEIEQKNEKIAELQQKLYMADLSASQTAQTAALIANNTQQSRDLIQRIAPYPTPAYIVGNPYGYNGYNSGCGCGNGSGTII